MDSLGSISTFDGAEVDESPRSGRRRPFLCVRGVAMVCALALASVSAAQTTSTATGGNGGAGGAATGGSATGGTANGGAATNTNNTSGVSNASGGTGGTASASGGNVGSVSTGASSAQTGASSATLGDITVNYNLPNSPTGRAGLGVGVDPDTGHVVSDTNVKYSGSYKMKNTPEVVVGGPASGPCNGFSGGFGFSMAGIGVGGNTSTVDAGCTARETARVAAMIGRMDIANAVLESMPAVQAALRAKAERDRAAEAAQPPSAARPAQPAAATPPPAVPDAESARREAALREQQRLAQEALTRQATMAKVNDTLRFTDANGQAREKTPQQLMAEEAQRPSQPATVAAAGPKPDAGERSKADDEAGGAPRAAASAPIEPAPVAATRDELAPAAPAQATTTQSPAPPVWSPPMTSPPATSSQPPVPLQTAALHDARSGDGVKSAVASGASSPAGSKQATTSSDTRLQAVKNALNLH